MGQNRRVKILKQNINSGSVTEKGFHSVTKKKNYLFNLCQIGTDYVDTIKCPADLVSGMIWWSLKNTLADNLITGTNAYKSISSQRRNKYLYTMLIRKMVQPGAKTDGLLSPIYGSQCTKEENGGGWGVERHRNMVLSILVTQAKLAGINWRETKAAQKRSFSKYKCKTQEGRHQALLPIQKSWELFCYWEEPWRQSLVYSGVLETTGVWFWNSPLITKTVK